MLLGFWFSPTLVFRHKWSAHACGTFWLFEIFWLLWIYQLAFRSDRRWVCFDNWFQLIVEQFLGRSYRGSMYPPGGTHVVRLVL